MTNCKYLTKTGKCGLKGSYAYRRKCFGEDLCRCREPMTNADRINSMTIEEKAEFLSSIAYGRETPWCKPFAEEFCKSCPTTTCTAEGYSNPMDLHECDFTDGKCPHGSDIVWWLQQPVKEDDHAL